ncbi:MAG: ATP-binding protein [Lentimicrobiaceae bacterium]|nr:ATP-binding protein [Lentimicrobiaceae bacterium]
MIERQIENQIRKKIGKGKAIIIMGARQIGKTTLLKRIFSENALWFNGDEIEVRNLFSNISAARLKALIGKQSTIVLDEAQRIEDIGLKLKLITDNLPDIQLVATGSSSFELANKINEPLTGRKWQYQMFPLSFAEMVNHHGLLQEKMMLNHRLVYGYYPDIVNNQGEEKELLQQLSDSVLYKDILKFDNIQKTDKLIKLLQALAYQVGSQVSYNELAQLCGIDGKTVEKYIMILEQAYIIFRLQPYSRNLRSELKNTRKIFFYDNGLRNALIADFRQVEMRTDIGALWENFIISERIKHLNYNGLWVNSWFWRTVEQKEIDYLEEADGQLSAYEFKWNADAKVKFPKQFTETYQNSTLTVIHRDNLEVFLL